MGKEISIEIADPNCRMTIWTESRFKSMEWKDPIINCQIEGIDKESPDNKKVLSIHLDRHDLTALIGCLKSIKKRLK